MNNNLNNLLADLSDYLEISPMVSYFSELTERPNLIDDIESAVKDEEFFETKKFNSIFDLRLYRILLYLIIRSKKPECIIETGVLHGLTTEFLLSALQKNEFGNLISIDMPSYYGLPPANNDGFNFTLLPNKEPGWIVNKKYHKRWKLYLGKSIEVLPKIFPLKMDMFIHDSEHTYETMLFELNFAWKYLENGGILICDNINANTSFFDFCRRIGKVPFIIRYEIDDFNSGIRFGIIKK